MVFSRERTQDWPPAAAFPNYAVIHPGTRWRRKRWPKEKWIELGRHLLGRLPALIISAGGAVVDKAYIQFGPWDHKGYKGDFLTIRELRGGELRFDGYHRPEWPSNNP